MSAVNVDDARAARELGLRIARILGIHKEHGVDRSMVEGLQPLLAHLAQHPQLDPQAELEAFYQRSTSERPQMHMSMALVDLAWLVPRGSRLEGAVAALAQGYIEQMTEWESRVVRDFVRERQWSPYPFVRRLACLIREFEPVDEQELQILRYLIHATPDLRVEVSRRIVRNGQREHLGELLKYLLGAIYGVGPSIAERGAAPRTLDLLGNLDLGKRDLLRLFRAYANHFEHFEISGRLMRVLSAQGERFMATAVDLARRHSEYFEPSVRLLRQMAEFGRLGALQDLAELALEARGEQFQIIGRHLLKAVDILTWASGLDQRRERLLGNIEAVCARIGKIPTASHRRLVEDLRAATHALDATSADGESEIDALIELVLAGHATNAERRLRLAGHRGAQALVAVAEDESLETSQRILALTNLALYKDTAFAPLLFDEVWRIYSNGSSVAIRARGLRTMAELDVAADDEMRSVLWHDLETARAVAEQRPLEHTIEKVWGRLFSESPPSRTSPAEEGSVDG